MNRRRALATMISAAIPAAICKPAIQRVIRGGQHLGKVFPETPLAAVVQFLQQPQVNKDVWETIDRVTDMFERRTGVSESRGTVNRRLTAKAYHVSLGDVAMNMPHGGTPRGRTAKPVNLAVYPIISRNDEIQDRYMRLRYAGQSHSISEMLAYQQAPGAMTDRELTMNVGTLDKQLTPQDQRFLEADVRRNGNPPNPNSVYQPQLAEHPFDRKAFVTGGGDIRERCEELGVGCEGFVNVKSPGSRLERDPLEGSGKVAPDLQQLIAKQRVQKNPGLRGMDLSDDINAVHGTNLHRPR